MERFDAMPRNSKKEDFLKSDEEIFNIYKDEYEELEEKIAPLDQIVFSEPDEDNIDAHNEWQKKMDERSLIEIRMLDLSAKKTFIEEYDLNKNRISENLDKLINMAENDNPETGSLEVLNRLGQLHEVNLFLDVCRHKNLKDSVELENKKQKLSLLVEPLIKAQGERLKKLKKGRLQK